MIVGSIFQNHPRVSSLKTENPIYWTIDFYCFERRTISDKSSNNISKVLILRFIYIYIYINIFDNYYNNKYVYCKQIIVFLQLLFPLFCTSTSYSIIITILILFKKKLLENQQLSKHTSSYIMQYCSKLSSSEFIAISCPIHHFITRRLHKLDLSLCHRIIDSHHQ